MAGYIYIYLVPDQFSSQEKMIEIKWNCTFKCKSFSPFVFM